MAEAVRVADGFAGIQVVERSFLLLEHLAAAGGSMSLTELTEASGLPATTIHRILRTLVAGGYVRQETSKIYTLGPRMIFIGRVAGAFLGAWARPYLGRLVERVGETANLAAMDADEVVYLAQVASQRHMLRMFVDVGRRVAPHATAEGKVLLAQATDAQIRRLIADRGLPAQTSRTITQEWALMRQIELVREQGYAVDDGEQELGVRSVAVPVPGGPRDLALSVSGPETRLSMPALSELVPILQETAMELGRL
ncbi:IclR family transcriptional regulator [Spongiactinospora gelatinilytica]|uniref:Glycerol operon regulatory protein n=1 Tax=Spongiactinospora gelatinilytica TaxID=2666298 RepID=A0A2W2H4D2_9ACTN|nr:IclR family transcriptional regulator [Spongiactinospora gelatinilytica]PZG41117.1 IclR family transcriptional regulator [Spongiactinospora gelatinilytica]